MEHADSTHIPKNSDAASSDVALPQQTVPATKESNSSVAAKAAKARAERATVAQSSRFDGIGFIDQVRAGGAVARYGCTDSAAVTAIQSALSALGHDLGTIDGLWGPATSRAVRSFQSANGLTADALVGKQTMAALIARDTGAPPKSQKKTLPGKKTEDKKTGGDKGKGKPAGGGAGAADEWDSAYGTKKTWLGQTYETYKGNIGELGASSDHGGTKRDNPEITIEQLFFVFPDLANDAEGSSEIMGYAKDFVTYLNQAWMLMEIDTVEAQAVFLAHAFVESNQFRQLSEAQKKKYETDPTKAELFEHDLNQLYPADTKRGRTINPTGDWNFIGRGPLQVTHRHLFVQTLAYMERKAEQYEANGQTEQAAPMREAVTAIKADPKQASNPKYTFLFSTAYMKMAGGDAKVLKAGHKSFGGKGAESSWMTGGAKDPKAAMKKGAYERALEVLQGKES